MIKRLVVAAVASTIAILPLSSAGASAAPVKPAKPVVSTQAIDWE